VQAGSIYGGHISETQDHYARSQPEQFLRQSAFLTYLGEENMRPHVEAAL